MLDRRWSITWRDSARRLEKTGSYLYDLYAVFFFTLGNGSRNRTSRLNGSSSLLPPAIPSLLLFPIYAFVIHIRRHPARDCQSPKNDRRSPTCRRRYSMDESSGKSQLEIEQIDVAFELGTREARNMGVIARAFRAESWAIANYGRGWTNINRRHSEYSSCTNDVQRWWREYGRVLSKIKSLRSPIAHDERIGARSPILQVSAFFPRHMTRNDIAHGIKRAFILKV